MSVSCDQREAEGIRDARVRVQPRLVCRNDSPGVRPAYKRCNTEEQSLLSRDLGVYVVTDKPNLIVNSADKERVDWDGLVTWREKMRETQLAKIW